ncbi:MAG: hypothetical protein ACK5V3_00960, partial [Bdellovibrionales bacterium]
VKRRFILGGLGLALLSLRSLVSQFGPNQNKNSQSKKGDTKAMENLVTLSAKQEFILPKNPTDGHFIIFRAADELTEGSAVIRRNGSLIMGQKEDLEVDLKAQFTLVYSENHKSWGLG